MAPLEFPLEKPMSETIKVTALDGVFSAYVAKPRALVGNRSLHEVFGVNADMREICNELAEKEYIALCPDLFWRQEPGLDLSDWTEAEWKKGLALYNAYDFDVGVSDIVDTVAVARTPDGASGKVGVMGFCLGGLMTLLTAARGNADAAVAYYGGGTENHLGEAGAVSVPMLMHLDEEDEFISKDAQRKITQAFASNALVEIHSYPGCSHAFARHTMIRPQRRLRMNERRLSSLSNCVDAYPRDTSVRRCRKGVAESGSLTDRLTQSRLFAGHRKQKT
jgi:carboxymethylenebutenolidase